MDSGQSRDAIVVLCSRKEERKGMIERPPSRLAAVRLSRRTRLHTSKVGSSQNVLSNRILPTAHSECSRSAHERCPRRGAADLRVRGDDW